MHRLSILFLLLLLVCGCSIGRANKPASGRNPLHGDGLVVLCYHDVYSPGSLALGRFLSPCKQFTRYSISTSEFTDQLDYLRRHGVRFVTPQEAEEYLIGHRSFSGKLVLVTFDDGHLSIYKKALPLLKKRGVPFLFFLLAGQVGKKWEGFTMCSWNQIREMLRKGYCTVGLHTYDMHYIEHRTKSDRVRLFTADTAKGIECLERQLGIKVRYFAYPYGYGTLDTNKILMSRGIALIFTLKMGINYPGCATSAIKRVLVTPEVWPYVAEWAREG